MKLPWYWLSDDRTVGIVNGKCEDVLPSIQPRYVSLLLTDPPYGVNYQHDNFNRGRSVLGTAENYDFVNNDDKSFDPSHLLRYPRLALFGANYYAEKLPPSPSWFVWDKLNGMTSKREIGFNDSADIEMVWTNLGGPARIIPHRWIGILKDSENRDKRRHPTQKPILLMQKIVEWYTSENDLILDPYMGSGSTLIGAKRAKRRVIGIETSERYCRETMLVLCHEFGYTARE